ncbi:MAG TPA: hypothetical protein VHB51_02365 [Candidatus Saccharimonadales bacterium]|nr:hypothetical protein [Candidatus Saccharimonadales bacterium]
MPKKEAGVYSFDVPVNARKVALQRQLLLIFLPLLIIAAYCAGYIQYRVDHQPNLSTNKHQNDTSQGMQQIKDSDLQPQSGASTVPLPESSNDSAAQAGNSSGKYLQNSSTHTNGKHGKLHVSGSDSQGSDWYTDFHY